MTKEVRPVCLCVPKIGIRPDLLSSELNRSASNDQLNVSPNSAFTPVSMSNSKNGLEKSRSAAFLFNNSSIKNLKKMDSFHELHVDIPIDYLSSEPNSSILTPSPKGDRQFLRPLPFFSPIPIETSPPKRVEPEKPTHFKEILSHFQNAAHARTNSIRAAESRSLDDSTDRSGSDSSLNKVNFKMPGSTTVSKTQSRTIITEHFSSEEEDKGIVKDIIFQNNQKRIPIKNPQPMLRNTNSLLSLNIKEQPRMTNRVVDSLSVSMFSPKAMNSPTGSVRSRISDGLFYQMAQSHSSTLAFVSESLPKLVQEFGSAGREIYDQASLSNIVFKSNTPVFIKDKIAIFDAAFIATNYVEYPISVLISTANQYAPLLGRHAERSGFGPAVLAEFEELEIEMRHFLQETGYELKPMTTLRIIVMPPMNVCSIQSLAAHYLSKNLNVQKVEEQITFVMIQLLSALKCLQSDGIEQLSNNFKEFILSYPNADNKNLLQTIDQLPKLMLLKNAMEEYNEDQLSVLTFSEDSAPQQSHQTVGLCKFAIRALCILLNRKLQGPLPEIAERTRFSIPLRKAAKILNAERFNSMSEAKQILEFSFFGAGNIFESEYDAKLWLDERRAQFVNQIVRWLIQRDPEIVSPKQQLYLSFLLSSSPRGIFKVSHQLRQSL